MRGNRIRSARTLLTTAAASAVLVLGAPAASAVGNDHGDSSYGQEQGGEHSEETWQDPSRDGQHKEHGVEKDHSESGKYDGGANDGGKHDGGANDGGKHDGGKHDGGSWRGEHEKPRGGMHTGGGALAAPTVTAGGLAVLAVAGTGLYAARRRRPTGSAA
ncbi:hypothetical protein [Streptomyces sp. enrichment culture]|uniref:hypothetical protein n=1 Tax=Streptomyces sp. enrichment culture TaxID=1795815 RepID=UPI003F567F5D